MNKGRTDAMRSPTAAVPNNADWAAKKWKVQRSGKGKEHLNSPAWGSAETPGSLRGNNESCKEELPWWSSEGGAAVVECGGPASWLL